MSRIDGVSIGSFDWLDFGGFLSLDWLSGSILEDFYPSISQKKVFSFVRPRSRAKPGPRRMLAVSR